MRAGISAAQARAVARMEATLAAEEERFTRVRITGWRYRDDTPVEVRTQVEKPFRSEIHARVHVRMSMRTSVRMSMPVAIVHAHAHARAHEHVHAHARR